MKKDVWGYLFAGISAAAGIAYLYIQRNNGPAQAVTNVFPPLNTNDPASDDLGVLPTSDTSNSGTTQNPQKVTVAYPVYLV